MRLIIAVIQLVAWITVVETVVPKNDTQVIIIAFFTAVCTVSVSLLVYFHFDEGKKKKYRRMIDDLLNPK